MGGGMETNKNKWIEDWSTARENLEHNFRWTRRNFALVGIFGIAIPILVYKGIVRDFCGSTLIGNEEHEPFVLRRTVLCLHMQDEDAGRPYRKFL